jgi:HSP20 family protein
VNVKKSSEKNSGPGGIEGMISGFGEILNRLADLAEKGEELKKTGQVSWQSGDDKVSGVCGFSIKTDIGGKGYKVEPFGNIKKDKESGRTVVEEFREPVVDVFEEKDHILILAEIPGIGVEDVLLEARDDVLEISAEKGTKRYRKEILLPRVCLREKMTMNCNNGILEIRCEY